MNIKGESIQNGEPTPEHPVEIENKINLTGAIQILNKLKSKVTLVKVDDENNSEKEYRLPYLTSIEKQAIDTVLSELEKKEKQIDLMAEQLAGLAIFDIDKDESLTQMYIDDRAYKYTGQTVKEFILDNSEEVEE